MRWLYLYLFLTLSAVFQSLFLNFDWSPVILWPTVFYFFLYQNGLSALCLLFFVSLLSSVFLSLSVPSLFFIYLLGFVSIKIVSFFVSYKSIGFFLLGSGICSFLFCNLIQGFPVFSSAWPESLFTLIQPLTTGLMALLFFPVLKKIFPISEGD